MNIFLYQFMKYIFLLSVLSFLYGCFPDFSATRKDRLYLKEIYFDEFLVEWFYYSAAYSGLSPDYIVVSQKGKDMDTICIARNIAKIEKEESEVLSIFFYGKPDLIPADRMIHGKVLGIEIKYDTSMKRVNFKPRKSYMKK